MGTSARDMVGVCVGESVCVCVCVRYDGPMPLCMYLFMCNAPAANNVARQQLPRGV